MQLGDEHVDGGVREENERETHHRQARREPPERRAAARGRRGEKACERERSLVRPPVRVIGRPRAQEADAGPVPSAKKAEPSGVGSPGPDTNVGRRVVIRKVFDGARPTPVEVEAQPTRRNARTGCLGVTWARIAPLRSGSGRGAGAPGIRRGHMKRRAGIRTGPGAVGCQAGPPRTAEEAEELHRAERSVRRSSGLRVERRGVQDSAHDGAVADRPEALRFRM